MAPPPRRRHTTAGVILGILAFLGLVALILGTYRATSGLGGHGEEGFPSGAAYTDGSPETVAPGPGGWREREGDRPDVGGALREGPRTGRARIERPSGVDELVTTPERTGPGGPDIGPHDDAWPQDPTPFGRVGRADVTLRTLEPLFEDDASPYIGSAVQVPEVRVRDIVSPQILTVEEGGDEIVVRLAQPFTGTLKEGDDVALTGKLRPLRQLDAASLGLDDPGDSELFVDGARLGLPG